METITVKQMAIALDITLTAVREGIARKHFPFAYCFGNGKKRTFVIDRYGFERYLRATGRSEEHIEERLRYAHIY